ncbi:Ankyrin repeat-containing protein 14 [Elsinoe fawcettii]|nr:Ankyrin repeat-containing protein 14 [Elsinoe fawcettii]
MAAQCGHDNILELLLKDRLDKIEGRDERGCTPLMTAAQEWSISTVKLLLEKGADVNASGGSYGTALQAAAYKGHADCIQLLIHWRANVNAQGGKYGNALRAAISCSHTKVVELLLSNDADVNAGGGRNESALYAAVIHGNELVVDLLLRHGANISTVGRRSASLLRAAALRRHTGVMRLLLLAGADIFILDRKPVASVTVSASTTDERTIELLVNRATDIDQINVEDSALCSAARHGDVAAIGALLDTGTEIEADGGISGNTLQIAALHGHNATVSLLIERGANVDAEGGAYGTALHAASLIRNSVIVRTLLDANASTRLPDKHGWLPYHLYSSHKPEQIEPTTPGFPSDRDDVLPSMLAPKRFVKAVPSSSICISSSGRTFITDKSACWELAERLQVRGDHPFPIHDQRPYFEIEIEQTGEKSLIALGFCQDLSYTMGLPGWRTGSWALHLDDGTLYLESYLGKVYCAPMACGSKDVMGCGINYGTDELFFTKNGTYLGLAARAPRGRLYPVVGVGDVGVSVKVNFGPEDFKFDTAAFFSSNYSRRRSEILRGEEKVVDAGVVSAVKATTMGKGEGYLLCHR